MKWIGLTGGIGTGKSTVSEILRGRGYPVVDADILARQAVAKGSAGLLAVVREFGPTIQTNDGELDRKEMAKLVFNSKTNLERLEKILHPIVRSLAQAERENLEKSGKKIAFYDVPLLFEKKMQNMFDCVVVVSASAEKQIARLKSREGWNDSQIRERMANQIPMEFKIKNANFVINNDGSVLELEKQIEALEESLKK